MNVRVPTVVVMVPGLRASSLTYRRQHDSLYSQKRPLYLPNQGIPGGRGSGQPAVGAPACRHANGVGRPLSTSRQDPAPMNRNQQLFERAQRSIPGGVNSPVRAFRSVGGTPPFIARAQGAHVWDADDRRYIDLVGSWGPMILGHAHPAVVRAVQTTAERGLSFGAPTELEVEFAERIVSLVPSIEQLRLVS